MLRYRAQLGTDSGMAVTHGDRVQSRLVLSLGKSSDIPVLARSLTRGLSSLWAGTSPASGLSISRVVLGTGLCQGRATAQGG